MRRRSGGDRSLRLLIRASLSLLIFPRVALAVRVVVVGGGAAGFFGATRAASEAKAAEGEAEVVLLEQSPTVLTKVCSSIPFFGLHF